MPLGGSDDLDRELERELTRQAERLTGPSPNPSQSAYHRSPGVRGPRSVLSAVARASRGPLASLVAACLLGAGGVVGATAASGSPNPVVWGTTVTRAVATCRDSLAPGQPGIGPCEAAPAREKAPAEPPAHVAATPVPGPTTPSSGAPTAAAHQPPVAASAVPSAGTSQDGGTPGSGRPSTPSPQANGQATGRPSTVVTGPPAAPGRSASAPGRSAPAPGRSAPAPAANPGRSTAKPPVHR